MQVFKREGSSFWWYTFTAAGTRIRESSKRTDYDEAVEVANRHYRRIMDARQLGARSTMTVGEATRRYVEAQDRPSTKASYDLSRRKLLGLGGFSGRIWHISPDEPMTIVDEALVADLTDHRRGEGLTNNSVNVELRFLSGTYNLCRKRWKVEVAPDVEFPLLPKFEKTRYLTDAEEAAILKSLSTQSTSAYRKAQDLFIFLIDTGLRLQEAIELSTGDIDRVNGKVEVWRQKTDSVGEVYLTDRAIEVINRLHNQPVPFDAMTRAVRILRIIINETCNNNERIIRQRGRATIHSLRDTFATRLVAKGMSLHQVSKLLGHTSIAMTRKYAHLEIRDVSMKARDLLNSSRQN